MPFLFDKFLMDRYHLYFWRLVTVDRYEREDNCNVVMLSLRLFVVDN